MDWQSIKDTLFSTEVVVTATVVTVVFVVASIAAVPFMVVRLPADYFAVPRPPLAERFRAAGAGERALIVLKNLGGAILVLLGVAMLVLPGQGVLTILLGLVLLDLPKKHVVERKIVERPAVRKALTRLRERFDRPPFEFTDEGEGDGAEHG